MPEPLLTRYMQPLLAGRQAECFALISDALHDGRPARDVISDVVWPAMNQVDRLFRADQINAALEISVPEFMQLVSHEVVPGHVTNIAWIQALYARRKLGFESTVLTMNTRGAARAEGIGVGWVSILDPVRIAEILEVPKDWTFIGHLCVGYPEEEHDTPALQRADWERRRPAAGTILYR